MCLWVLLSMERTGLTKYTRIGMSLGGRANAIEPGTAFGWHLFQQC